MNVRRQLWKSSPNSPQSFRSNHRDGTWAWANNNTFNVQAFLTAGLHTIKVGTKKQLFGIDDILFVNDVTYDWQNDAETEGYSLYPVSGGGVDPDNPLLPLGPPIVVDDKTPDPFPFGSRIDVATSTTNVESISVLIEGINVPTEIGIVAGSDASAEYEIDNSGSWVTADGTVVNGSSVVCRLDASSSNSTTVSMSLKIGTVTHTFEVVTISATAPGLVLVTSTITVSANNTTITGKNIQVANGIGIEIKPGVSGTIITNNRISTPNGHAVEAHNIIDLTMHHNDVMDCWGSGAYIDVFESVNIYDNNFENLHTGVDLWGGRQGGIVVTGNWFKNMFRRETGVPSKRGNGVALRYCIGAGILIDNNIIISVPGQTTIEDKISCWISSGTPVSPILLTNNKLHGKGDSTSCTTILPGDGGGDNYLLEDNICVNAGQTGMGSGRGDSIILRGNKILCIPLYAFSDPSLGISNVGLAPGFIAFNADPTKPPTNQTIEGNQITFWKAANYDNRGGVETLVPYWFKDISFYGPGDIAGWLTNLMDGSPSHSPASLTEANTWDPAWDIKPTRLA